MSLGTACACAHETVKDGRTPAAKDGEAGCKGGGDAPISLRPHHGMCLAFFEGKGYSEGFTAHMGRILSLLEGIPAECDTASGGDALSRFIRLTVAVDSICAACPNNRDGACDSAERVKLFDEAVLARCGLQEGQTMPFAEFAQKVQNQIIASGDRGQICGGCQWEWICANRRSRWEEITQTHEG